MRGLSRNEWKLTMNDPGENTREIRINPIVPTESVLVAMARGMRPKEAEERVERGEHFVAIKPFASRFEWEIHILPLKHQADFLKASRTVVNSTTARRATIGISRSVRAPASRPGLSWDLDFLSAR